MWEAERGGGGGGGGGGGSKHGVDSKERGRLI